MTRSEFAKCCMGACSLAAVGAVIPADAQAQQSGADAAKVAEGKLDASRQRFANLVQIMSAELGEDARKKIFRNMGRECARSNGSFINKYKGNLQGFLEEGRRQWMESATYDAKTGVLRVADKSKTCNCPAVKQGQTPGAFCDCSVGWQEETYSTIVGRPVKVRLESSLLRGGARCAFVIETA